MIGTEVVHDRDHRCVVVQVAGEVDIATVPELAGALRDAQDRAVAESSPAVVCDLRRVTFFAAAGVHCLQRASAELRAAGVAPQLVLDGVATTTPVLGLMVPVCGWPVHDDIETALRTVLGVGPRSDDARR